MEVSISGKDGPVLSPSRPGTWRSNVGGQLCKAFGGQITHMAFMAAAQNRFGTNMEPTGKWNQRLKPAVGPSSLILRHTQKAVVVKTVLGSHFGVGAPPILVGILVGIGMFTGGTEV